MKIICKSSNYPQFFTSGKSYQVISKPGDDITCMDHEQLKFLGLPTKVQDGSYEVENNVGLVSYINTKNPCQFGEWEIVQ